MFQNCKFKLIVEVDWKWFIKNIKYLESSCYSISDEELIYVYGQEVCEQKGGNMVSIHDDYEQAFVHSYVSFLIFWSIKF